jgi:Tfp pilus assembly protein PilN
MSTQPLSFLPTGYLAAKARKRSFAFGGALFLIVLAGVGGAWPVTQRAVRQMEAEQAAVDREYQQASLRIEQVHKMQQAQLTLAKQAELTATLLEKVPRSYLLAQITQALPNGASLLELDLESKVRQPPPAPVPAAQSSTSGDSKPAAPKPDPNAPRVYDVSVRLTGIAPGDVEVAQLIARLNRSPLLTDVNLVVTSELAQSDKAERKFVVEAVVDPDASAASAERNKPTGTAVLETQ